MYWKFYSNVAKITFTIVNAITGVLFKLASKVNDYCYNKVEKHYSKHTIQPDVEAIFDKTK